jgi:hypothetical protein
MPGRMKRIALGALVVASLAACGKSGGGDAIGQDWSKRPLKAVEASLEDTMLDVKRTATFTIDLPDKMKKEDRGSGHVEWRADQKDEWSEPSVTVGFAMLPKSAEDALSTTMPEKDDVIVKSEALGDGFIVVSHTKDKGIVRVEVWKKRGDGEALTCRASQAKDGGVPSPDATLGWLEKICTSLTVK